MQTQPIPGYVPKTKIEARSYFRRSFILYERSESIAQQLCLVERDVLLAVQWEELVHCRWTKMNTNVDGRQDGKNEDPHFTDKSQKSPRFDSSLHHGVQDAIQRFNVVCQWVASEIVRAPNLEVRVRTIEKFIRIAEKCRMYSNFATLIQVLLGLQAPAVSRLHKTWSKVRNSELKILDELSSFTSPTKNWKHMRDSMTTIPFGGCIPFLGIYLSDLVSNQKDISPLLKQPLVNFSKHRVTAMIIKRVLTFQNLARRYPFELNVDLFSRCNELECLTPDVIKGLSHVTERHNA
ncbi:hypothetical protein K450DRAFT_170181 [Umbelopsis ramanniana AG]|uniref:Ras-GEF domain-containing protein n=1 Tax=Umbelopsis ramanniana AG TaxID=1314678 RepID=A0AAD5EG64_UMBRA|nr:uncharacterized protein K450DRAFT_170181 [Umbelopsis ramanniana AG]KAI8582802.1 hypothetical protein K450DRAFT_170181 [Umbelopsis ramanniana AG]